MRFSEYLNAIKAENVDMVFITSRLSNVGWGRINGNICGNSGIN